MCVSHGSPALFYIQKNWYIEWPDREQGLAKWQHTYLVRSPTKSARGTLAACSLDRPALRTTPEGIVLPRLRAKGSIRHGNGLGKEDEFVKLEYEIRRLGKTAETRLSTWVQGTYHFPVKLIEAFTIELFLLSGFSVIFV